MSDVSLEFLDEMFLVLEGRFFNQQVKPRIVKHGNQIFKCIGNACQAIGTTAGNVMYDVAGKASDKLASKDNEYRNSITNMGNDYNTERMYAGGAINMGRMISNYPEQRRQSIQQSFGGNLPTHTQNKNQWIEDYNKWLTHQRFTDPALRSEYKNMNPQQRRQFALNKYREDLSGTKGSVVDELNQMI